MNAACHRCGARKPEAGDPCADCGYLPEGDERALAWLFSRAHLDEAELAEASRRVREGERPEPGRALIAEARRALGGSPGDPEDTLSRPAQLALGVGSVLLTPLLGLAIWFGLRPTRPAAARLALRVTASASLAFVAMWIAALIRY